jgi:hypothetical protein
VRSLYVEIVLIRKFNDHKNLMGSGNKVMYRDFKIDKTGPVFTVFDKTGPVRF